MPYTGSCHCGAVQFQVTANPTKFVDCNCSICTKKGFLHWIVPAEAFTLLKGEADLITYTFNTGAAKHTFCRRCGIHAFYRPRSHPDGYSVNVRCVDQNILDQAEILPFDGQNWEESIVNLA